MGSTKSRLPFLVLSSVLAVGCAQPIAAVRYHYLGNCDIQSANGTSGLLVYGFDSITNHGNVSVDFKPDQISVLGSSGGQKIAPIATLGGITNLPTISETVVSGGQTVSFPKGALGGMVAGADGRYQLLYSNASDAAVKVILVQDNLTRTAWPVAKCDNVDPHVSTYIYVARDNGQGGTIDTYAVDNSSGNVTPSGLPPQKTVKSFAPTGIIVSPRLDAIVVTTTNDVEWYGRSVTTGGIIANSGQLVNSGADPGLGPEFGPGITSFAMHPRETSLWIADAFAGGGALAAALINGKYVGAPPLTAGAQTGLNPAKHWTLSADPGAAFLYCLTDQGFFGAFNANDLGFGTPFLSSPSWAGTEVASSNLYAFVGGVNEIFEFAVVNGTMTVKSTIVTPTPVALAVDPTGAYVYSADAAGLRTFSVDPVNGTLKLVAQLAGGSAQTRIAVDPFGRFLFALDLANSTLTSYSINSDTGALTQAASISAGTVPVAFAVGGNLQ